MRYQLYVRHRLVRSRTTAVFVPLDSTKVVFRVGFRWRLWFDLNGVRDSGLFIKLN